MRRIALAAVAVALLVAGAAAAYGHLAGPDDAAVTDTAQRLDRYLRDSFSTTFAGLRAEPDRGRVVIYRKPDPYLDAAVRDQAGDVAVDLRDAPHSFADLEPLAQRIDADRPYWRRQGIQVDFVWPLWDGSAVGVTISHGDLTALQRAFRERYDDDRIVVHRPGAVVPAG